MTVVVGLDSSLSLFTVCKRHASFVEPTFHGLCNCECTFREDVEGHGNGGSWAIEAGYESIHELFHREV